MDRLFTVEILTIVSVLEILLMLKTAILTTELIIVFLSLGLIFLMLLNLNKKDFWKLGVIVLFVNVFNIAYLYIVLGCDYMLHIAALLTLIGFIMFMLGRKIHRKAQPVQFVQPKKVEIEKEIKGWDEQIPEVVIEEYPVEKPKKPRKKKTVKRKTTKKQVSAKKKTTKKSTVKKTAAKKTSRRYAASVKAKAYHIAKCNWVDNIKRKNKIYFSSRRKAESLGYTAHTCLDNNKTNAVKVSKRKAPKKTTRKKAVKKMTYSRKTKPNKVKQTKKVYKPGKYVASTQAKNYHAPKCSWANNIKAKNRVWFNSRIKAENLGYEPHSCLK